MRDIAELAILWGKRKSARINKLYANFNIYVYIWYIIYVVVFVVFFSSNSNMNNLRAIQFGWFFFGFDKMMTVQITHGFNVEAWSKSGHLQDMNWYFEDF